jgi:hypothetical protein
MVCGIMLYVIIYFFKFFLRKLIDLFFIFRLMSKCPDSGVKLICPKYSTSAYTTMHGNSNRKLCCILVEQCYLLILVEQCFRTNFG